MSNLYAMQRANGDWFAFEEQGQLRVPVFLSSHDARQAWARNWGMLLFRPAIFGEHALNELAPTGSEKGIYFWLADGSSTQLSHGHLIGHARLALLIHDPKEQPPDLNGLRKRL
jgi:hypothetical protein